MNWLLTLAYFFHLVATVLWVGGILLFPLVVLPVAQTSLPAEHSARFFLALQRRFAPLAMFSIGILAVSGLMQMSAHPQYSGVLQVDSTWAWAIFLKHIAYLGMVLLGMYEIWILLPALGRAQLLALAQKDSPQQAKLQAQAQRNYWLSLAIALLVLACTALARALS